MMYIYWITLVFWKACRIFQHLCKPRREETLGEYNWIVDTVDKKYEVCRFTPDTRKKGVVGAQFFRIVWLHEYCLVGEYGFSFRPLN